MTSITTPPNAPPLSKARRAGDLLFVSGQLPRGTDGKIIDGDLAAQTRQALANLQAVLANHGAEMRHVVKVTAWLTDLSQIELFNRVYCELLAEPYPARSVVEAGLAAGAAVEIEAVAWLGELRS